MSYKNHTEDHPQVELFWDNCHAIHREDGRESLNHSINVDYIAIHLKQYAEVCHKRGMDAGNIRGLRTWLQFGKCHPFVANKTVRSQHNKNKKVRCLVFERFPDGAERRPHVRRITTNLPEFAMGALADELYRVAFSIEEVLLLMEGKAGQDYTAMDLVQEAGRYLRADERWKELELPIPIEPRGQIIWPQGATHDQSSQPDPTTDHSTGGKL